MMQDTVFFSYGKHVKTRSLGPIVKKPDSLLWNAYIERYHYLKYQPMPGAQLRYFVRSNDQIIAALGFGASAWKVKLRDQLRQTLCHL